MNAPEKIFLPDVQSGPDRRNLAIQRVGVKDITHPLTVVTERASDNPKFVEDLVRDVALAVEALDAVAAYTVESENFESIHNHSAYALIERVKP